MTLKESQIEQHLIDKLGELKYTVRPDIRDKAALEQNFRDKFEALNHVQLTDAEFARLRDDIITPMFSRRPKRCANTAIFSARTARRCTTRWSTSRTGARTTSRSSTSCASTPTTATTATT